ncbi:MAG: NfeD family protein [Acidimicrobiia bacterium]
MLLPSTTRMALVLILASVGGLAADAIASVSDSRQVEIIDVSGLLDDATLRFLTSGIERAAEHDREVVIVQLDSPGVIGGRSRLEEAADLLANPPLPVVVWLGPAPARAGGGAAQLLAVAAHVAAAPGTTVENWSPAIAATDEMLIPQPDGLALPLMVSDRIPGLVDRISPSIRQLIQDLDGEVLVGGDRARTISTITAVEGGEGFTTIPTSFTQPGLVHRFRHLAARPEAAFFFLAVGLSVVVFEFYAIGPGLAAATAAVLLYLASFGLAVLPVNWWAVAATLAGIALLAAGYQKGGVAALSLIGTVLLTWSGFNFSLGSPQVHSGPAGVVFTVLAALFFFLLAIPTVGRARFSTQTIGRESLIGKKGRAVSAFTPGGVVEIEGARWPATAHREAGIDVGTEVVVTALSGWRVEVDPTREN